MGKSGNPAKASSAANFKKRVGGLLELPSGEFVKARNAGGLRGFVSGGMIPNSLMPIIDEAIKKGKEPDMSKIITPEGIDPKMMEDMLEMIDSVVMSVMVEPEVHPKPASEAERDDDLLYIDEIEDEDKMFLFQWVTGGTRDLERFRAELTAGVEHLAKLPVSKSTTKRPARAKA